MNELTKARWICVDDYFCTEFGISIEDCIERYRNSMDEGVDVSKLTFYEMKDPYIAEAVYILKRKPE